MVILFFIQVNINWPSGKQKKVLRDSDNAQVIKYLALGLNRTAMKTAMKNKELARELTEIVFNKIDDECQALCKKDSTSILRNNRPAALIDFKLQDLKNEMLQKVPTLTSLLSKICKSKRSQEKPQVKAEEVVVPTVASTILHSRCPEMSALTYRLGLILRHAGAGTLVMNDFSILSA